MVVSLMKGRRRLYWVLAALVLIMDAIALVIALPLDSLPVYVPVIGMYAVEVFMFFYYVRHFRKEKLRYPLVPPEGKGDVYSPRSDIPRPIYEDMRRAREQRRKFAKLDKLRRRKKQP